SLSGNSEEFIFGKYGGGITRFETSYQRQSSGYDVNDIGYLQRADIQSWNNWAALNFFKRTAVYNSLRINGNFWNRWTSAGLPLEHAVNTNAHIVLQRQASAGAGGTLGQLGTVYCDRCARGGPAVRQSSYLAPWFYITGDDRRRIAPSISANFQRSDEGRSHYMSLDPSVAIQATSQLLFSLDVNAAHNDDNSQWIGNFTDSASNAMHYAFAHLHQNTL